MKFFIHWTFLFIIIWIAWIISEQIRLNYERSELASSLGMIIAALLSIAFYASGHLLMMKFLGYTPKEIVIFPIGSVVRMDEIPKKNRHEVLISLAGPSLNLFTAGILYLLFYWFSNIPSFFTVFFKEGDTFLFNLMLANLFLALSNFLPVFPTAAGKILKLLLLKKTDRVNTVNMLTITGQIIVLVVFFIGLFFYPIIAFAGVFIFVMIQMESGYYTASNSILYGYKVKNAMAHQFFTLDALNTINDAIKKLLDGQATDFLITEKGNVIGTLDRNGIIKALYEKGKDASVTTVMNKELTLLTPDMPLDWAYTRLNGSPLPVIENDKIIGIVDKDNIKEFIMTRTAEKVKNYV